LEEPPQPHTAIPADPKTFDAYAGRYELAPQFILTILREGDHLYAQATGQARFEIFPEGERKFFAKVADIQIEFGQDSLTLRQSGSITNAKRLNGEAPAGTAPVRKQD